MSINLDILQEIIRTSYVVPIAREYGTAGSVALAETLEAIRKLYNFIEPELIKGTLVVCKNLTQVPLSIPSKSSKLFNDLTHLAHEYMALSHATPTIIEVQQSGEYLLWIDTDTEIADLSQDSIVYKYHDRKEHFIVKGSPQLILNPSSVHSSVFAIPTYRELAEALEDFRIKSISASSCKIFQQAWSDPNKLFFKNGPEEIMRNSLAQYLKDVLRNAEVRPEQNVDESHPVDIKVTWMLTNRIALVEIKWLGKSINEKGNLVDYFDARANEGARQLADYLDANKVQAPAYLTMGYLVVIDGRRRGLNKSSTSINQTN